MCLPDLLLRSSPSIHLLPLPPSTCFLSLHRLASSPSIYLLSLPPSTCFLSLHLLASSPSIYLLSLPPSTCFLSLHLLASSPSIYLLPLPPSTCFLSLHLLSFSPSIYLLPLPPSTCFLSLHLLASSPSIYLLPLPPSTCFLSLHPLASSPSIYLLPLPPSHLHSDTCAIKSCNLTVSVCMKDAADATPTVSTTSFTFYMLPSYGVTPATYTMRLTYNGCTNLTASSARDIQSYGSVQDAPEGVASCLEIRAYYQAGCIGTYNLFPVAKGSLSTSSVP
ncbi:unnamed protein product [Closterium sp. NIES-53]